tara:strand:- start:93 stop:392 length:300 start_codon:yes stop_codon:yes gene_type:complete
MDTEKIEQIVAAYVKKKEYENNRYHEVKKLDPEWVIKNRENSLRHYHNNKEKKKLYYEKNRQKILVNQNYKYALKKNKVEQFKIKYPEEYARLEKEGRL